MWFYLRFAIYLLYYLNIALEHRVCTVHVVIGHVAFSTSQVLLRCAHDSCLHLSELVRTDGHLVIHVAYWCAKCPVWTSIVCVEHVQYFVF